MKNETIFDKIDAYFDKQPDKNLFRLTFILSCLVFAYLVYEYTYLDSEEFVEEKQEILSKAESDLKVLDDFIENEKKNSRVESLKIELKKYEEERQKIYEENEYFAKKLKEASNLLYNQKNWSDFMGKINEAAVKYNIKLGDISSNINDPMSQKVEEIFNVSFNMSSRFQNILHFINNLENSVDMVDVKNLNMYISNAVENKKYKNENTSEANAKDINADVKILVWGIKY